MTKNFLTLSLIITILVITACNSTNKTAVNNNIKPPEESTAAIEPESSKYPKMHGFEIYDGPCIHEDISYYITYKKDFDLAEFEEETAFENFKKFAESVYPVYKEETKTENGFYIYLVNEEKKFNTTCFSGDNEEDTKFHVDDEIEAYFCYYENETFICSE